MSEIATVFIIEDNEDLVQIYKIWLNLSGFKIFGTAYNGKDAIQIFKSSNPKPDIILMDHRMPIKNGLETTKEILKMDMSAKIIFASADKTIKDEALSIGAKEFLEKPFKNSRLIESIMQILKIE